MFYGNFFCFVGSIFCFPLFLSGHPPKANVHFVRRFTLVPLSFRLSPGFTVRRQPTNKFTLGEFQWTGIQKLCSFPKIIADLMCARMFHRAWQVYIGLSIHSAWSAFLMCYLIYFEINRHQRALSDINLNLLYSNRGRHPYKVHISDLFFQKVSIKKDGSSKPWEHHACRQYTYMGRHWIGKSIKNGAVYTDKKSYSYTVWY